MAIDQTAAQTETLLADSLGASSLKTCENMIRVTSISGIKRLPHLSDLYSSISLKDNVLKSQQIRFYIMIYQY